jgi:hypothetical protein
MLGELLPQTNQFFSMSTITSQCCSLDAPNAKSAKVDLVDWWTGELLD